MILFAQSQFSPPVEIAGWLACVLFIVMLFNAASKAYDRLAGKTKIPQPMNVEIVKALHEQFADKKEFEKLASHNTERHGQLFASIARVEREAREMVEKKFVALNEERAESLRHLNDQFTFIRESLVAVQTELKIRHK